MKEILDQGCAVVLLDQVDDALGQVVLATQVDAVFNVSDDDQRAHRRREIGMSACRADLVLDEVVGLEHLADVVKVSADSHQRRLAPIRSAAASAIAPTVIE